MNKLSDDQRAKVVAALIEGNSIRSTVRMTGVAKNTVQKLLLDLGAAFSEYLDKSIRNLKSERVQIDELWSFVAAKQKNVAPAIVSRTGYAGDAWTFVAIDADSKLVISWMVGPRDAKSAKNFLDDVSGRLSNLVQVTTDGHKMYFSAVPDAFPQGVDFAMLVKIYGAPNDGETRYSPAQCLGCESHAITGNPDPKHISTSYIERQNLTVRMSNRRFTRLTNAFSKKIESHIASIALHYVYYNFVRIHQTLRVTPAMQAGIADHAWSVAELVKTLL